MKHLHRTDARETPMNDQALLALVTMLQGRPDDSGISICCGCLCQLIARLAKTEQELEMARKFVGVLQ